MLNRFAIAFAVIAAVVVLLFAFPVAAAPSAQTALPDFTLNAQTVISVTVAISDGQVIVVPVDLNFIVQNANGETDVSVIADVEQQAGIFIGVAPSRLTTADVQLPQTEASIAASSTSVAQAANQTGTHVANRNSNLRSGPGTNFSIVGRVEAGGTVSIVGQNADGTWLQLDNGNWIAEFLADPVATNTPEPTPTATPTAIPIDTPTAIPTVIPTAIPTVAPTDIPTAIPTTTEESDADQATLTAYLSDLATIGVEALGAIDALNGFIEDPQPTSADWRNDVAAQLAALSSALDQYLNLQPVPGYENLTSQVTDVSFACEQAVDYLARGLENPSTLDPNLATQAVRYCASQASSLSSAVQTLQ